jgi:hypothetical protein
MPPSKVTVALLTTSVLSAVWAGAMLTPVGRIAYVYLFAYSEFYMGVLSLVSLSVTVMMGLVATDRMVLSVRQRVLMQSAHRTTGIIAIAALGIHVMTKLSMARIGVIDLFIPFIAKNQTVYIGLGTLAGYFMVSVVWTGIVRARFAGRGKPWLWRSLHSLAYLSWPIALVHGLSAGRAAASWVIASYVVCVVFVLGALVVRLSMSLGRKKNFSSTSTGSLKPVGKLVPTASPSVKNRAKRRPEREVAVEPISAHVVADRSNAPTAVVESWSGAGAGPAAPVSARPAMSGNRPADEEYRPAARERRYADEEPPEPRRRATEPELRYVEPEARYVDDERPEPRRRYAEDERLAAPRGRRYAEPEARYDEPPPPRSRRYAEDEETVAPRPRRYADEDRPAPRERSDDRDRNRDEERYDAPRQRRYAEPELRRDEAPRPRRYAEQEEPPVPRSRSTELERYEDVPRGRSRRDPVDEDRTASRGRRYVEPEPRFDQVPPPRSSRYVDDVEPAPRSRTERSAANSRAEYGDREDSGRHSRAALTEPADPWGAPTGTDSNYLPPDDTPTLIDMASRRARRATSDAPRGASRGARRRGRGEDAADDLYLRQLRGEAQ